MTPMPEPSIKPPRAPRRRQSEVDEARRQKNDALRELAQVRRELQRVRRDVRAVVRESKTYPASYLRDAFAKDVLDAIRSQETADV